MRAVLQRVKKASVEIDGKIKSSIENGMLILLGIEHEDTHEDIHWLIQKIIRIRIFDDAEGIMNINIQDIKGEILIISQFTLHASTKKGNRPSYIKAARPAYAIPLYEKFIAEIQQATSSLKIATGVFGADMQVMLINDGPVTIWLDSKNKE
jgi:D-tyrosyl-tRNA(Tyr) deacylase